MKSMLFCLILGIHVYSFVGAMYNGEYRAVKDHPYVVQLFCDDEIGPLGFCGAAILSEYWAISAAHCFGYKDKAQYHIRVGSSTKFSNGIIIDIEKVLLYGDCYPDFGYDNDFALIKLKTPIELNEYQQPIQLTKDSPKVGANITVLGFGQHHHGVSGIALRVAQTSVIEDKICYQYEKLQYTKNMICTSVKNIDLCYGDSGGPAIYDNRLIGINSQGCEYTIPNVLTKTANYYDWILQTTGIKYTD